MKSLISLLLLVSTFHVHADPYGDAIALGRELRRQNPTKEIYPGDSIPNLLNQMPYRDSYRAFPNMRYTDFDTKGHKFLAKHRVQLDVEVLDPHFSSLNGAKKLMPKEVGNSDFFNSAVPGMESQINRYCSNLHITDLDRCEEIINDRDFVNGFAFRVATFQDVGLGSMPDIVGPVGTHINCDLQFDDVSVVSEIGGYQRYNTLLEGMNKEMPKLISKENSYRLGKKHKLCVTRTDLNNIAPIGYRFSRNALTVRDTIYVNPSFFLVYSKKIQSEVLLQEQLYQFIDAEKFEDRVDQVNNAMTVIIEFFDNKEVYANEELGEALNCRAINLAIDPK